MSYWPPLIIQGKDVDLTHLEPFEFACLPRDFATNITISVRFNDHCFTETFKPNIHQDINIIPKPFTNATERRVFSEERYALSRSLPEILKTIHQHRICSTREGNLVRLEIKPNQNYAIFFTLRKRNSNRAELFVVSAYPTDPSKRIADTGEMKFDLALAKIMRGEKPKFPKR